MNNGFVIVHILGAVQGVFLAAVLLSRGRGALANRLLAATLLAFALDLATAVYHATGYDAVFPHLIGIDFPLALLYGPLLYFYAAALARRERRFRRRHLWHFLPFALLVVFLLPFYGQAGAAKLAYLHAPEPGLWTQTLGVINHLKLVHGLVYIVLLLLLLRRHARTPGAARLDLTWLRSLTGILLGMVGTVVVFYLLALREETPVIGLDAATEYDDYTLLTLALFVYAIGFLGLRRPGVFDDARPAAPALLPEAEAAPPPPAVDGAEAEADKPQYAKSGMDPETAERYRAALLAVMETEKLYRRGDLTLQDLSDALSISPHNLTEVINTQLGQNFYDFVNGYRVREVQARLADPSYAHFTLLAIGTDAGFNSKSSFNAVFKKHTAMTPSQFRAQARKAARS